MNFAVLLAAGSSSRFGGTVSGANLPSSKLHTEVCPGVPLWRLPFQVFRTNPRLAGVGIVARPGEERLFSEAGADFVVPGGESRLDSARIGVAHVPEECAIVLVHDAARPLVTESLVHRVLDAAAEYGAAVPCIPATDTLKTGVDFVDSTLKREHVLTAQTPQAARRDWLLEALGEAKQATDEASALEAAGRKVRIVQGDPRNFKVTWYADLQLVQAACTVLEARTGFGYDIHRFSDDPNKRLVLGGVSFPDEPGLEGHSDGDPVLHAITDALLGAQGEGDIGELFPDTDERWRGADSKIFLREALSRVAARGSTIANVDVTIIAERPRLGLAKQEIRKTLSKEMGLPVERVSIKATTHEGIGAVGRGEGIAAYSVVTIHTRRLAMEETIDGPAR